MFKDHNIRKATAFCLARLVGLCFITYLLFILFNIGNESGYQSQIKGDYLKSATSTNDSESPVKHRVDYAKNSLERINEAAIDTDNTTPKDCSVGCSSALSLIDQDLSVDDETYHRLEAYIREISTYLRYDEGKRQQYLQLALTTTDSDKRSFLIDIFENLPYQQKVEMGEVLTGSDNWRTRAGGVTLIAGHDISSLEMVTTLMNILSKEEHAYVKSSILSYIKQGSALQGDVEVLQQLDSVIYNETESSVRVAALKAKMQLSEQPYHILPDALHALRTSEPEVQLAGLVVINQLLEHEQEYIEKGVYIGKDSIKNEIQNIRNLLTDGSDNDRKRFAHMIKEANTIYLRYFEYN